MANLLLGLVLLYVAFSAQAQTNPCLESLESTGCALRWEVDASSVTGSSTHMNTRTTPNVMFKLDYQWATHNEPIVSHLIFKTGYTQVPVATRIQPAVVVDAGATFGWTLGPSVEIGAGVRGSFEDLIPNDQIIQRGGLSYVDLNSANQTTVAGLYEATGHLKISSIGHVGGNVSNLLVIEVGYQNNSGLQQLGRNRIVGRFYAYPEISSTNHTKILFGLEYSAGFDGAAKIVQVFLGANLNPVKLLHPD